MRAAFVIGLVLLLALPAAAEPITKGEIQAARADLDGPAHQVGVLGLLQVKGDLLAEKPGLTWLRIHGQHVVVEQFNDTGYVVPIPGGDAINTVRMTNFANPPPPQVTAADDATLQMALAQIGFAVNLQADGPTNLAGDLRDGSYATIQDPVLNYDGIAPASAEDRPSQQPYFSEMALPGNHLLLNGNKEPFNLALAGDFTLEVVGVDFAVASGGKPAGEVTSTAQQQRVLGDTIQERQEGFLRITVQGGSLELQVAESGESAQWTLSSMDGLVHGMTFYNAEGVVREAGLQRHLDDDRLAVGTATIKAMPSGDLLTVHITPAKGPSGNTFVSGPAATWTAVVIGSAVLAALAAALTVALRSRHNVPRLDQMEEALARGDYAGASRLADAILRRQPGQEDAVIGKAIALSKGGHHAKVIREVGAHIRRREPSDGVLHYVLGLAYLETGQREAGAEALHEAVRRTPALHAEVAPRLGLPARPTSKGIPEGYV